VARKHNFYNPSDPLPLAVKIVGTDVTLLMGRWSHSTRTHLPLVLDLFESPNTPRNYNGLGPAYDYLRMVARPFTRDRNRCSLLTREHLSGFKTVLLAIGEWRFKHVMLCMDICSARRAGVDADRLAPLINNISRLCQILPRVCIGLASDADFDACERWTTQTLALLRPVDDAQTVLPWEEL